MKKTAHITDQLENLSIDSPVLPKLRDQWHSLSLIVRVPLSQSLNRYVLLVLFIICTLFALVITSLRPTDVTIQGMSNRIQNITLPLREHSKRKIQKYVITGNFSYGLFSQHIIHIVPDNCIQSFQINGVPVNLHAIIRGKLCDSTNGFDIDLKSYLRNGTNHFQVGLIGYGRDRWFGLSLTYSTYDSQYLFLFYILLHILLLEFGALLYLFLQNQLQLPRECVMVILLGLLLHIIYLGYTPYNVRTYDVTQYGGHLDYIKYVAAHWKLPDPTRGWEYHHPPLYYISAAIIYKIATTLSLNYLIALQVLSLVYFTVFLIVGVLILRMLCQNKWMLLIGTALLVSWPSGVIHAIRINNDIPYYTLSAIGVYFLLRWLADKESKYFYLATLFVALTITTKLDGLILVGLVVCVGLLLLFRKVRTIVSHAQLNNCFEISHLFHLFHKEMVKAEYIRKSLLFIIIIILACYISLFRSISVFLQNRHYDLLVSNVSRVNPTLDVGNSLCNYVCFDMNIYRNQPFTNTRNDKEGRQYFFNFFLKSMLFGEYKFSFPHVQFLAGVLSLLLLQMIPFLFIGIGLSMRKITSSHAMMLLWLALSFSALIYVRYRYPFSSFQDFRYIYPAIIPFIYFYVKGIEFFKQRELIIISSLEYIIAFLFVITSFCFFIMPLGT